MKATASVILVALLFILGIFLVLAIGGGLLALLAYGVGQILNRIVHFDPFQVTVISLAGMLVFGILAERIWQAIISAPPLSPDLDEEEDEFDFEEDYFDDEEEEEEEEDESVIYPGIPRWRQPLKTPDFSNVKPDDRCPCGSGRKYKNCHGRKK
jgi:hypothetical protein